MHTKCADILFMFKLKYLKRILLKKIQTHSLNKHSQQKKSYTHHPKPNPHFKAWLLKQEMLLKAISTIKLSIDILIRSKLSILTC